MCNMYGIIESLCREHGIKPGKLCAELGISRGIMSDLKAGRTKQLSVENVGKIATYFGVSVGYLLGKEETKKEPILGNEDGREAEAKRLFEALSDEGKASALNYLRYLATNSDNQ